MWENFDLWKFMAGLGLFLFGMSRLEIGINELAGRGFKVFIKKHTKNKIKAIFGGALVTAILQSSSVVSLMLLAFVGAGVISMKNALGIILGSNIGTTFTSWLVATLGFKIDIESFIFPFLALGALLVVLFQKRQRLLNIGLLVLGFAFLFLGLSYMKDSISFLAENLDISLFAEYHISVFFIVGFIFTAIVQTSVATMVIALSALNAGIIDFQFAASLIIGANLGTTITALIGGSQGTASKKRVALSHFLFNLVTVIVAFMLLKYIILFITDVLQIKDELLGLVAFHFSFNMLGIILFYPFLDQFANFLNKRYAGGNDREGIYIHESSVEEPESALEALRKETNHLVSLVLKLWSIAFHQKSEESSDSGNLNIFKLEKNLQDHYSQIKRLHGEIINFYGDLQKQSLTGDESSNLSNVITATGNALHAAKDIKDIEDNLTTFRKSGNNTLNSLYESFNDISLTMIEKFKQMTSSKADDMSLEEYGELMIDIQKNYDKILQKVYDHPNRKHLKEEEIATVLNVNRQLYSTNKAIIRALKDYKLSPDLSAQFENLPHFR